MKEWTAFLIWALCGAAMIGIGGYAHISKKTMGFWANTEKLPVKDVKHYNRAVGRLFIGYGAVQILLGLPLLDRQNQGLVLVSLVGVMAETIAIMILYTLKVEKKYRG